VFRYQADECLADAGGEISPAHLGIQGFSCYFQEIDERALVHIRWAPEATLATLWNESAIFRLHHNHIMFRSLLISIGSLTATALCAQFTATVKTSVTSVERASWQKWSNDQCSMNYPLGWTSEGSGINDRAASFQAPTDSTGLWKERVELYVKPAADMPLAQHAEAAQAEVTSLLSDSQVVSANLANETHIIEYTGSINGRSVRLKQEIVAKGDRVWILNYCAAADRYDDGLYMAEAMFSSLALK
jgi:hypothetical protein